MTPAPCYGSATLAQWEETPEAVLSFLCFVGQNLPCSLASPAPSQGTVPGAESQWERGRAGGWLWGSGAFPNALLPVWH